MSISSGIRSRRTKIRLRRTLIALALFSVGAASGAGASLAADFPVTTTADAGAGSLRQAIVDANAAAGADDIKFAIPGTGVKTINVTSDLLPEITGPVTINGYTQSGSSPNTKTRDQGTDTVLRVEISGEFSTLRLKTGSSTIKGLVINCVGTSLCQNAGVSIEGSNNVVTGNFIGTNSTGTGMAGSATARFQDGVRIITGANNRVGGTAPADRNLLSGDSNAGVAVNASDASQLVDGTVIQGNYVGTDAAGSTPLSTNNNNGVQIRGGFGGVVTNTTVGGDVAGAGNLIAGNQYGELAIQGAVDGGTVYGNLIGTKRDGVSAISATSAQSGGGVEMANTRGFAIGGPTAAKANTVAFKAIGIVVDSANGIADGVGDRNRISGNSIHDNTDLGIDLGRNSGVDQNDPLDVDTGPNEQQNYPVLSSAAVSGGNTTISGSLPSKARTTYRVEFFASHACDTTPNASPAYQGFGEGETYLGAANVTTDATGVATFSGLSFPAPAGQPVITATATDPVGNTSEFSKCLSAAAGGDTTPPDTTIESGPSGAIDDSTPTFTFSSNEGGSSFECRVDSGAFAACSSPYTTAPLGDGPHTFEVRAIDPANNVDPTPAARSFTVVQVQPEPPSPSPQPQPPSPQPQPQPQPPAPPVTATCEGHAATIVASPGRRTRGTRRADVIVGSSGADRIDGRGGDDIICAGAGADRVSGSSGQDRLLGGGGRDRMRGGSGNDRIAGGSGSDRLKGGSGDDRIIGGAGDDVVVGGAGRGRDTVDTGSGNDRVETRDHGARDRVDCGSGRDRARLDHVDRPRGCERLRFR